MAPDPHAYLKWPRLISFTVQAALAVTATGLAANSIQLLREDKAQLVSQLPDAELNATSAIAVTAIMVTAAGIAALYTFALSQIVIFKLQKRETLRTIRIKEALMAVMSLFLLGSAIAATVVIPSGTATVSSKTIPQPFLLRIIQLSGKSLAYRDSYAFPCMIVVWVCFGFTLASFALAALAARHIATHGDEDTLVGHEVEKQQNNGHRFAHNHEHEGRPTTATSDRAVSNEKPATASRHGELAAAGVLPPPPNRSV